jgi:long-chain acyl-CoA synthetase
MDLESPPRPGRVAARLARQVELALATVDLTLSQYRILIILGEGKEAASSLADKLAVTRPSITAVVDGLVARGLVERHADQGDRRRVSHDITAAGLETLARADIAVDEWLAEIAAAGATADDGATGDSSSTGSAEQAFAELNSWHAALRSYKSCRKVAATAVAG